VIGIGCATEARRSELSFILIARQSRRHRVTHDGSSCSEPECQIYSIADA
jgi:hypothetical protein